MNITEILRKPELRNDFISSFDLTADHGSIKKIIEFVDQNLHRNKHIEASFELSILIRHYTEVHLKVAKDMLRKRTSYLLKLTILDYLLSVFDSVDKHIFAELNEIAKGNTNPLVAFQGALNLVCANAEEITPFLQGSFFPFSTFYYRLISSLSNSDALMKVFEKKLDIVSTNIKLSTINEPQKAELLRLVADLKDRRGRQSVSGADS